MAEQERERLKQGIASLGRTVAEFIPGVGDAMTAREAYEAAKEGKYGTAGLLAVLAGIGLIPGAGDVAGAVGKNMLKKADELPGRWYHASSKNRQHYSTASDEEIRRMRNEGIEEFKPSTGHGRAVYVSPDPKFAEATQLHYPVGQSIEGKSKQVLESNIATYPLRVKAGKYFDYDNPEHVAAVAARLPYPDNERFVQRLADGRLSSNWGDIEDKADLLRELGFEGMYIKESGKKNLGVFDPAALKSSLSAPRNPDWSNRNISKAKGGMINAPTETPANYSKGRWRLI